MSGCRASTGIGFADAGDMGMLGGGGDLLTGAYPAENPQDSSTTSAA